MRMSAGMRSIIAKIKNANPNIDIENVKAPRISIEIDNKKITLSEEETRLVLDQMEILDRLFPNDNDGNTLLLALADIIDTRFDIFKFKMEE